jgi:hypothetical protein
MFGLAWQGEALAVATEKGIVAFSHKLYKEASTHTVGDIVKVCVECSPYCALLFTLV